MSRLLSPFFRLTLGLIVFLIVGAALILGLLRLTPQEPYCLSVLGPGSEGELISPTRGDEIPINLGTRSTGSRTISPDGLYTVYEQQGGGGTQDAILVRSNQTGKTATIPNEQIFSPVSWSHDGSHWALAAVSGGVIVATADGTDYRIVPGTIRVNSRLIWSDDDQYLAAQEAGFLSVIRLSDLTVRSTPIHPDVTMIQSRSGYFAYLYNGRSVSPQPAWIMTLAVFDADTGVERIVDTSRGNWSSRIQISADRRYVAARKFEKDTARLMLYDLSGDTVQQTVLDDQYNARDRDAFNWSADGQAYLYVKAGALMLYSMKDRQAQTLIPYNVIFAAPTPQPRTWLAWVVNERLTLTLIQEDGSSKTFLRDLDAMDPSIAYYWISDTVLIASVYRENRSQVVRVDTQSGQSTVLLDNLRTFPQRIQAYPELTFWWMTTSGEVGLAHFNSATKNLDLYRIDADADMFAPGSSQVLFAPDDRFAALQINETLNASSIQLASSDGKPPHVLYKGAWLGLASVDSWKWTPDSTLFAYRTPMQGVEVVNTDGDSLLHRYQYRYQSIFWSSCAAGDPTP